MELIVFYTNILNDAFFSTTIKKIYSQRIIRQFSDNFYHIGSSLNNETSQKTLRKFTH